MSLEFSRHIETLPSGSYIKLEDCAWLVLGNSLRAWSADAYQDRRPRPTSGSVVVLTPPSIVAVLHAGYVAAVHPSGAG